MKPVTGSTAKLSILSGYPALKNADRHNSVADKNSVWHWRARL